jgi:hypothetical protein
MIGTAACACGDAQVTVTGNPTINAICHCLNCRRRTGSAFSWHAYWPTAAVTSSGKLHAYDLAPEWGQRRHFCPRCGTTLMWTTKWNLDETGIAVGALEPPLPAPAESYRDSCRFAWLALPTACVAKR